MKYSIIVLVITTILAVTAYILDLTNNKNDRIFLITVGSLLLLTSLFFGIRGKILEHNESLAQVESLKSTQNNTEELKKNQS